MKDSLITSDSPEQARGFDRRRFLRRAGAIAAGGLGAGALLGRPGAPVPSASLAGAHPGEPYFFRIETMARTVGAPAVKEV
jgi:hypothetical protein